MNPSPGKSMGEPAAWTGRLLLAPGRIIYLGPAAGAERHRHHAVQFLYAPDEPFTAEIEGVTRTTHAALFPANAQHSITAGGQRVALLLFEAHGARGRALDDRARAGMHAASGATAAAINVPTSATIAPIHLFPDVPRPPILVPSNTTTSGIGLALSELSLPSPDATTGEVLDWCDTVTALLGGHVIERGLSHATRVAIDYLHEAIDSEPRIEEAARRAAVAPTTLTHRFTREVGIPFRRLVLWVRLKRATEAVERGGNLTEAALEAGFSDSAHLSRTFRATFGLSPSATLPLLEIEGSLWARVAPSGRS
jgi:AraC-like DNA-binding protein